MEAPTINDTTNTLANLIANEEEPSFYIREPIAMTIYFQVPTAIAIWLLIIIAIIGNAMAIAAYITDKNLHNVYNYYIFHLAIADLLMAVSSMSVHSIYVLKGMMWPYGKTACKIWLVIDFTLCLQQIFLMLILSVDRLLLVSLGMNYSRIVTMTSAHVIMIISWMLAFCVYGPAIIWWEVWKGASWVPYHIECDVEFANDALYTTITAMFEFTLPFVCLTVLNMLLYFKIRRRNRIKPAQEGSNVQTARGTVNVTGSSTAVTNVTDSNKDGAEGNGSALSTVEGSNSINAVERKPVAPRRSDAKALRFLAILVIVFLICWAPYIIATTVISFCEVNCIDINLYELFIWILWVKSAINPFLYAYNSKVYRDHFAKYIMFWKR